MPTKQSLNLKVKNLRVKLNLSQEQVAKFLGINRVSLSHIESWDREIKLSELQKISEIFEIDVNTLLEIQTKSNQSRLTPSDKHYKLEQLVIYLSSKLSAKQNFGETLLNKLLYFIDFDYYERTGSLITDEEYVKLPYGPVPKDMGKVLEDMQQNWLIKMITREYFGKKQKAIMPLVDSDVNFLEDIDHKNHQTEENYTPYLDLPHPKKIIKEVLEKYGSWNADALSDRSHNDVPYQSTKKIGEIISPWLVFYRKWWYIINPHNLSENQD